MGTTETSHPITPFWYRRVSEITWLVTCILVGLWAAGEFLAPDTILELGLIVPVISLAGCVVASLMMLVGYVRPRHKSSCRLIKFGYILLLLTSLYTVVASDNANSPYIALWIFVSVFAAIFGLGVLVPTALAANIYLGYLYFFNIVQPESMLVLVIAFEVPLATSLLIWRKGVKHTSTGDPEKDPTFKALAKELNQVSNKSEIVINAIADGVVAVDGQGVVQLINPAAQRIIGWGKQDALRLDYRSILQLFDHKNQAVTDGADPIQKCLHTNETVETDELLLATTSGKKLMVSILVSPVGQIGAGAIVVFRDITAARAEERQQAEFISTASHEMRTPVAAIEGYIGLALNPATATIDDKAKMYLGKAHESAQHLGRLFQDLLDISKAEDNRLDSEPRVLDLVAYVRDITASFNHMATTKGLILLYKPDTGTAADQRVSPAFFVKVDPDHIREVTANLIENAIKYTKSGDVTVDVTGDDEHTTIAITDTGIGIPQEDIPHLFQKFYRVDNSDTREIGGTGLGLYLCRRLIETMGGRIWVTSTYGKGSTFHIELPRMSNIDAMRAIEASANQPETAKLHATPSFLPAEEEAAAIQQATATPAATAQAQPAPAATTPMPTLAPVAAVVAAPATPAPVPTPAAPVAAPTPAPAPVAPATPLPAATPTTPAPAPQPAAPTATSAVPAPVPQTAAAVPSIAIAEDGSVTTPPGSLVSDSRASTQSTDGRTPGVAL